MIKLSKIITIIGGGTPSKLISHYWNGSIPWASVKDLRSDYIEKTIDSITLEAVSNSATQIIPKGSIIIGTRMAVGKVSVNLVDLAINQDLKAIICSDKVFYKFLFYFLKSKEEYLNSLASGATVKGIKLEHIKNLEIPLPPLATQKHIADILDAADALRRKTQQIVDSYDELVQSLFLEMFGDPVSNPRGWVKKRFCDLFESRLGKMLDIKKQIISDESIPYLGNSNVLWGKFNLNDLQQMTFSEKEKEKYSLKKGDLLICEGGEAGRCAIWNDDNSKFLFQKAIHRARKISEKINVCYVQMALYFLKQRGGLKNYLTSATIQHLTGEKLKLVPIPTPPIALQNQFAEKIALIEQQKELAKQSLAESENLFNALLQKAFKGELVPEPQPAEQTV